jgi:transposase-like protein
LTVDDALYRFRLPVFALAEELGNVRLACRMMGIHPSTFYRWRRQALRSEAPVEVRLRACAIASDQ